MRIIIQRYLAYHYLLPLLFSIPFFIIFLLTFQLFRFMDLIVNKDVPILQVLHLAGHICMTFFPLAVPISILFSAMYAMNKLSADSEIIAIRSIGISKTKLFTPILLLSSIIGLFTFILDSFHIPQARIEIRKIVSLLTTKGALVGIRKGQFFTQIPQFTLYAQDVSNQGLVLWDVFIQILNKNNTVEQIIMAKLGKILKDGDDITTFSTQLRMHLSDGNILKYTQNENSTVTEKILFKEYDFPIDQNRNLPNVDSGPSLQNTLTLYEAMKIKDFTPSFNKDDLIKTQLEFYSRTNNPFLCIFLSMLGFSLGIKRNRGSSKSSLGICFLSLIAYYALFFSGLSLAKKGTISVLLGLNIPLVILLIICLFFFFKLDWN